MIELFRKTVTSPIGDIDCLFTKNHLIYLDFSDNHRRQSRILSHRNGRYSVTDYEDVFDMEARLTNYFSQDWDAFKGLPLAANGTPFQQAVWKELRRIAPGEAISYATLADRLGQPKAIRAVGSANGANPISLAIPCHRVIGKDGSLRGYAGGEDRKRWLLGHEQMETHH
ncbi:MAG: methylated-DNA--[protein]-cysteine S-methyltransferase [Pseudomonadota bacterium]